MELRLNQAEPLIMFVDLNSCFASVAQQADPLLRSKPMVVAAYDSTRGCVLSASIEAKRLGVKTGMRVYEAQALSPGIIVRTPDVAMIEDVNAKFNKILQDYSSHVTPKSIDESIIDFHDAPICRSTNLEEIGKEIKQRIKYEVGDYIRCSIGISTNRFLAKTAASFRKPDGLVTITHKNVWDIYRQLALVDLHGISTGYETRLHTHGIFSPMDFYNAPEEKLWKSVFKSIEGRNWYKRLRGWEIDGDLGEQKTYGQQYTLKNPTKDELELSRIVMKLCEKMGRRLRDSKQLALGIHVGCQYVDRTYWHMGKKARSSSYSTLELFSRAMDVLAVQPDLKLISKISISCYDLVETNSQQPLLIETIQDRFHRKQIVLANVLDTINSRYGEFVVSPALMMNMKDSIRESIAFGKIRKL